MLRSTLWFALPLLLLLTSCRTYSGGVAPSTKPLAPGSYDVLGERVSGTDTVVHLLGILPLSDSNDTADALADALQEGGGDALIEVTADTWTEWWLLWVETTTEVTGIPVASR